MAEDWTYHFSAAENPAPELLPGPLPTGYVGRSTDEHLAGLYADLAHLHGVALATMPSMVHDVEAQLPAGTGFAEQAARVRDLLASAGLSFDSFTTPAGLWWDFAEHLPLRDSDAAGFYLLHLALTFGSDFEGMVPVLRVIFELENANEREQFVPISALQRFARLMSEAVEEDGFVFTITEAWQAAKVWEYAEVRKLLASDFDTEYGLRLAAIGFSSFAEVQEYATLIPQHWVDNLTEGLFDGTEGSGPDQ